MDRSAETDHPVQEFIATRWSPYSFSSRPVPGEVLHSLFEAARWTMSSYNEQPWRYLFSTAGEPDFPRVLSCLVEANQAWAQHVPVLVLGVTCDHFTRNDKPNAHALHDLGAASAALTFEATARGLHVHQMAGIDPERARSEFSIPPGFTPRTALAIGYAGSNPSLDADVAARDRNERRRRPLSEFVFDGAWGRGIA
ncbi:MAG: nitroreductase family protein [Planctomycetes bacterium]|nr:nitroreductase family protein [Planctomycetota bacterium]